MTTEVTREEIDQINKSLSAISMWIAGVQEDVNSLAAVVQSLSSQDPNTPDPFVDVFPDPPKPAEPVVVEKTILPSALMAKIWAMDIGEKLPFLDGNIEMIRKPGTNPSIEFYGMIVTDPGLIKMVHPDFINGYQNLSIRACLSELSIRLPEITVWMQKETGQVDWKKEYETAWQSQENHKQKAMYDQLTGLTHAYGEFTCKGTKVYGRVDGTPSLKELRDKWL